MLFIARPQPKAQQLLRTRLTRQRAAARQSLHGKGPPELVEDLEAVHDPGQGRAQELLRARVAEHAYRGVVGEQQRAVGRLRGHAVGYPAQDRLELDARGLALLLGPLTLGDVAQVAGEGRWL